MAVQQSDVGRHESGKYAVFEGWYRRHRSVVEGYCQRMLGDSASADDVTQEVFARAWLIAERYETEEHLRRWVFIVARNLCVDTIRARSRVVPRHQFEDCAEHDPGGNDELLARLDLAMTRLTARSRILLDLRYSDSLGNDAVATRMGMSIATTRVALHRARSELRRQLA